MRLWDYFLWLIWFKIYFMVVFDYCYSIELIEIVGSFIDPNAKYE